MKFSRKYVDFLKVSENREKNPHLHDPQKAQGGFDPTIGYGYSLKQANRSLAEVNSDFRKAGIAPLSPMEWRSIQRGEYNQINRTLTEPQMEKLLEITLDDYSKKIDVAAKQYDIDVNDFPPAIQDAVLDQWINGRGGLVFGPLTQQSNGALRDGEYGRFLGEVLLNSNDTNMVGIFNRRVGIVAHALQNLPPEEREKALRELSEFMRKNPKMIEDMQEAYRKSGKAPPDLSPLIKPEKPVKGTPTSSLDEAGGMVHVKGYGRGGSEVKAHARTRPDGDETNNLSYKADKKKPA